VSDYWADQAPGPAWGEGNASWMVYDAILCGVAIAGAYVDLGVAFALLVAMLFGPIGRG